MSSKATTALQRLREIDNKYKSRLGNKVRASSSDNSNGNGQEILRPRLNIQMPETYVELLANYIPQNAGKLVSEIPVISSAIQSPNSHNSHSGISDNSAGNLKGKSSECSEEILEQSISETLDKTRTSLSAAEESDTPKEKIINFNEFLDNCSNVIEEINENLSIKFESAESNKYMLTSGASAASSEIEIIESYSQEPFESNVSSSVENEYEEKETLASGSIDSSTRLMEIYEEDPRVIETAEKSLIIPNNSSIKSPFHESDRTDECSSKEPLPISEIESNKESQSDVNNQLENIELTPRRNAITSPAHCANAREEKEYNSEAHEEKNGNERIDAIGQLNESIISNISVTPEEAISHADKCELAEISEKSKTERGKDGTRSKTVIELHRSVTTEAKHEKRRTHHVRREYKHVSSTLRQYLRRVDEGNSHLKTFPSRLGFPENSCLQIIKPLQCPKIPNFTQQGEHQDHDPDIAFLRARLIDIRQWLNEQYTLYKDHCDLAASINRNYPVDLAHTKKEINRSRGREIAKTGD